MYFTAQKKYWSNNFWREEIGQTGRYSPDQTTFGEKQQSWRRWKEMRKKKTEKRKRKKRTRVIKDEIKRIKKKQRKYVFHLKVKNQSTRNVWLFASTDF